MIGISEKQEEMLAFIKSFVVQNGYPPTYEEIRVGLDISTKSLVNYHLEVLENARLLARVPNTSRGIRLINDGQPLQTQLLERSIPAAGLPNLDQTDILELTYGFTTNSTNLYALKINGNGAGAEFVNEGDIVIIQEQCNAQNGDLIAARLPGQRNICLKRYFRENGHVRLKSEDQTFADLIIEPTQLEIEGKIVAIIRQADQP